MSDTPQVDAFFNPRTVGELEWLTYNTVAAGLLSLARRLERESRSLASEMPYRQDAERYRLFRAACGTRDRMVGFCIREWFYSGTCAESTLDEALDKALANASPDK